MSLFDVLIRNGNIYDGSGAAPYVGSIAVDGDRIAAIGALPDASARIDLDARGLAVAPGFINMLSHAQLGLLVDGKSQSDIRQGVTLEVMGEGSSMGPLNDRMKADALAKQGDIRYEIEWTSLDEFLEHLVARGVSCNVASFIGSSNPREFFLNEEDRLPTAAELEQMCDLVRVAMQQGAMGVASALIYPPAAYSDTHELIALARVVAEYDGMYISHIRNEGSQIFEALDEFIRIVRETGVRGEIYHLKLAGQANWNKRDAVLEKIERAQAEGLRITADMYTYPASGTGINSYIPDWAHEGGLFALIERLKDPPTRVRIKEELQFATPPDKIFIVTLKNDKLKSLIGKSLAEIAAARGVAPADTLMDLIVEDESRVGAVFFSMSEENVRTQIARSWVSFGSDGGSLAPEGVFLKSSTHPRAYGNFARLLSKYVREEKVMPLQEAIRRLTSLPAENLKLDRRGALKEGNFADVVVFDPERVQEHATFENPHQYATGMVHILVNGVQVLKDGEHTGAKPGRVVRGPGWGK